MCERKSESEREIMIKVDREKRKGHVRAIHAETNSSVLAYINPHIL